MKKTNVSQAGVYESPLICEYVVSVERGFTVSNPWNDVDEGSDDINIGYGGMDEEFA